MNFDVSRLGRADRIVGGGAIALFIFLFFFKWYGVSSNVGSIAGLNGVDVNVSKTGWSVFTDSRWIWLLTIVIALGAVAIAAGALKLQSPIQPGVLVAGLGALSTLLILYRILHHPSASASYGSFHVSVGIKLGIWLGLIAAAVITYGGYLSMQAEGTSLADVRAQATDAMGNLRDAASTSQPPPAAPAGESSTPLPPPIAPTAAPSTTEPPAQTPPTE